MTITCILSMRDQPDQVVQMVNAPQEGEKMILLSDPVNPVGRERWVANVTPYPQGGLNLTLDGVPPDGPYLVVDLSPFPPERR